MTEKSLNNNKKKKKKKKKKSNDLLYSWFNASKRSQVNWNLVKTIFQDIFFFLSKSMILQFLF